MNISTLVRPILHVEVRLQQDSNIRPDSITHCVQEWLNENFIWLTLGVELKSGASGTHLIQENVESITVVEVTGSAAETLPLEEVDLAIHTYKLLHCKSILGIEEQEEMADVSDPEHPTARVLDLPASSLDGLWEFLIFDPDVKMKMLHYISSVLLFSDKKVNPYCININRLILLHGPPGSGKTSLCRALAQKLSIRLCHRYSHFKLVEINTHSLFSKYYSESGKLVGRMFDEIFTMLLDEDIFIVILIDEVESLTSARKAMICGSEPSDSLRAVNALLTALDRIRIKTNVIILTTSNLPDSMDTAFIDRIDIKQYVGPPSLQASYAILRTCLNELIRCEIIDSEEGGLPQFDVASLSLFSEPDAPSTKLYRIANSCAASKLSARTLKKLPLIMHANWIQRNKCTLGHCLEALESAIEEEKLSFVVGENCSLLVEEKYVYDRARCPRCLQSLLVPLISNANPDESYKR